MMKLNLELVPRSLWGKTLSRLSRAKSAWRSKWESIRKLELARTSGICEVCGEHAEIVHEKWEYDDTNHVQKLVGFEAICRKCSLVHHMGRASVIGLEKEAIDQFVKVNDVSMTEARKLMKAAAVKWKLRNGHKWVQDLVWLRNHASDYGITEADVHEAQNTMAAM
jgi:hypothetical protein